MSDPDTGANGRPVQKRAQICPSAMLGRAFFGVRCG